MTKGNKRKGKEENQRYVKLDDDMTSSAAWDALSSDAIWVYIELRKKFDYKNGGNNRLILPKREILWRMKDVTFAKRKRELIEFGFIDCVDPGGLYKRPAIYRLSDRWKKISRDLVTTIGREAIRSGLVKKPPSPQYRETCLKNIKSKKSKEKEPEKKIHHQKIDINIGAPRRGACERGPQAPRRGAYEASTGSTKGGLSGSTKGGLSLKDKSTKEPTPFSPRYVKRQISIKKRELQDPSLSIDRQNRIKAELKGWEMQLPESQRTN